MTFRAMPAAWVSATHVPETRPTCTVDDDGRQPRATGLLSADGWMIYDIPETVAFGFRGTTPAGGR
jgi:hypothetical protein